MDDQPYIAWVLPRTGRIYHRSLIYPGRMVEDQALCGVEPVRGWAMVRKSTPQTGRRTCIRCTAKAERLQSGLSLMPVHLRPITRQCEWVHDHQSRCPLDAKVALYSTANVILGYFCPQHGNPALTLAKLAEHAKG